MAATVLRHGDEQPTNLEPQRGVVGSGGPHIVADISTSVETPTHEPSEAKETRSSEIGPDPVQIYIAAQSIGIESELTYPFTHQQRVNIRNHFPIDSSHYDDYDDALLSVRVSYFLTISITSFAFVVFLLSLLRTDPHPEQYPIFLLTNFINDALLVPEIACPLVVLAWGVRFVIFLLLRSVFLRPFASQIQHHYNYILHEISDCEKSIGTRQDRVDEPLLSEKYARLLLWNVLRLREADRYASIVSWKMQSSCNNTWWGFLLFCLICFSATIPLRPENVDLLDILARCFFPLSILFVLFASLRWNRAYLSTTIQSKTHALSIARPFAEFGSCVHRLVVRAKANERRQN